ncbi:MAG: hypothetical protein K6B43_09525 [Treponema sp.]|nr:hypothetical protein [Treponema sp.]
MTLKMRDLIKKHKAVYKKYIGKIIYTFFLMSILESVLSSVLLAPILNSSVGDILSYILMAVGVMIFFLFHFGLASMFLRMTRGEFVTLGFLFYGFKKPKLSFATAFVFSALFIAILYLSGVFFRFVFADLAGNALLSASVLEKIAQSTSSVQELANTPEIQTQSKLLFYPFIIFALAFFFLVLIPFAFTFQLKHDNEKKSVFWAMKQSVIFMFSDFNYFRLIALAFVSSWRQIIITVFMTSVFVMSLASGGTLMTIITYFFFLLNFYATLASIMLSAPVFYSELTKKPAVGEILNVSV